VLQRHGGHNLLDHCAGERPENPLTDDRMCCANHLLGDPGSGSREDFGRRLDVESAHQSGQAGCVEAMDRGQRGGQLDCVTALRGQVQISPSDDILVGMRGKAPQAKSAQHSAETDLDADQFEAVVCAASKDDIGNPCHPLPHDVHDLGVEDVAHEQNLVLCKRIDRRGDRELRRALLIVDEDSRLIEPFYRSPWHQQIWTSTA
jgi:hypothetical protein